MGHASVIRGSYTRSVAAARSRSLAAPLLVVPGAGSRHIHRNLPARAIGIEIVRRTPRAEQVVERVSLPRLHQRIERARGAARRDPDAASVRMRSRKVMRLAAITPISFNVHVSVARISRLYTMPNILALSGSLRIKSFNTMLLHAVVDVAPAGTAIEIGSIKDIPLYNADVDAASGPPPAVRELKEQDRRHRWVAARQP